MAVVNPLSVLAQQRGYRIGPGIGAGTPPPYTGNTIVSPGIQGVQVRSSPLVFMGGCIDIRPVKRVDSPSGAAARLVRLYAQVSYAPYLNGDPQNPLEPVIEQIIPLALNGTRIPLPPCELQTVNVYVTANDDTCEFTFYVSYSNRVPTHFSCVDMGSPEGLVTSTTARTIPDYATTVNVQAYQPGGNYTLFFDDRFANIIAAYRVTSTTQVSKNLAIPNTAERWYLTTADVTSVYNIPVLFEGCK